MNTHTLNPYQHPVKSPSQVVVIPIPKSVLSKTAVSFLQFDRESPEGNHYVMILQAILYAVWKLRELAREKKLSCDQLTQLRLETVYSDDAEDPKVLGYRLFVFVMTTQLTLGEALEKLFEENAIIMEKYDNANSVSIGRQSGGPQAGGMQLPGTKGWRTRLWPHESYRLIKNKDMWARTLCDFYIGKTRTSSQIEKVNSSVLHLGTMDNPANPVRIFNIADAFGPRHTAANTHHEQKDLKNYWKRDVHSSTTDYDFPDLSRFANLSHHVLKVQSNEIQPSIFCYRWLPEHQHKKLTKLQEEILLEFPDLRGNWDNYARDISEGGAHLGDMEESPDLQSPDEELRNEVLQTEGIDNRPVEGETPFARSSLLENHMDAAMEMLNNRVFQYWYTSDFKALMEENKRQLEDIKKIPDSDAYRTAYEKFEKEAFESFEGRCWSSDSDISEIGHKIRAFGQRQDIRNFKTKHVKFDPSLSVFASMNIRKMEFFENYLMVSTAHKNLLFTVMSRLDAYRHSGSLHVNIIADGPAGVSKTFGYELEEKLSIDGTVEQIAYQSLRSDAIDR